MKRAPAALAQRRFDLVIIGGGITGACLAHDATQRGLAVALIDKGDFGAATSAASSKLLHGGIRYLQQVAFGKVRESALERIYFQNLAPHLIDWVPFIVPTYRGLARGRLLLGGGMATYGLLCLGQRAQLLDPSRREPSGRWLGRDEIARLVPGIDTERMTGGRLFHECHMHSSERMTLAFVDAAARGGAAVANYVAAAGLRQQEGTITGVVARDLSTGEEITIGARAVINAAGPWIRGLERELVGGEAHRIVSGFSKGAHIVTRSLTDGHAVALATRRRSESVVSRGGRHVFVIPWRGHSLIGTTYGPYDGDLDAVAPSRREIADLIGEVNTALGAGTLDPADVLYSYAGLYPLQADEIDPETYQGTGDYQIVDHSEVDGVEGLFTVLGAKYTTARRLAERALDHVGAWLGGCAPCCTRHRPLPVADFGDPDRFLEACVNSAPPGLGKASVAHLVRNYGADASALIDRIRANPELRQPLARQRQALAVEAVWAVEREMAVHLEDLVLRRTGLGTLGHPGESALRRCASLMGEVADWDEPRSVHEIETVSRRLLT